MSKLRGVSKRITALLLSGMLIIGLTSGSVLAASIDLDPSQTSEIAEEVYDEDTSEALAGEGEMAESEDASKAPAGAGESYPEEASANEEAVEYYTVTLDANGGYFEHEWDDVLEETVENTEVLNKTIPFGGIVEIVPVKDSATFLGWRLELDGEVLGAEYAPKENCTLYAAWQMEDGVIEGETTGGVPAVDEVPAEEGDPVEDVIEEELPAEEADGQETIDEGDVQEEEFVDDFEQFDAEQDTEVAAESETDELDPTQDAETAEVEETDAQYNAEGTAQVTSEAQEPEPENAEVGESAATSQIMDTKAKEQDATPEQDETAMIDAGEEYVSTDAAMEVVASGWCGDNLSWTLDDAGTLTISGTGEMWDFCPEYGTAGFEISDDSYYCIFRFYEIKTVEITKGVASIGEFAFYDCGDLRNVMISNSVTSIGEWAFRDCSSLASVTIPVSVTSIKRGAFSICEKLADVYYAGLKQEWDNISIEEENDDLTDAAIYYAKSPVIESGTCGEHLTWMLDDAGNLTISGTGEMWDFCPAYGTAGYESSDDSYYCIFRDYEIKTVKITKGVTSIGKYAFYECIYLQNVTNARNVKSIGNYAFEYCSSLTSVTISDSVTSIGNSAFFGCSRLTSVTIPNSVTSIGECAFIRCRSLTSVTIPDSVTSIGGHAFCDCSSLESVTISGSVASIDEYVFKDCTSLTSVTIPESVTSIGSNAFYDCSSLMSVTIPDSVTSIGAEAFKYCSALKTVTIPNSVTSIGAETFQNCGLTSVIIPDSVMEIGFNAFENCISLTSVTIPDSVTSIKSGTFQNCISLTSVTVPNSVWVIGDHAFCACSSLESVTIPDSVTNIKDWAFCNCTSLASVTIPDSVTSIGGSVFSNCRSLESVTIPDSVTSIGLCVFNECYKLKSVNIPDSVMDIGGYAFKYCTSLTSVTIPNSVTSIEAGTFQYCRSLESVTISDSVTSIGNSAFLGCSSLTSVSIPDSVTSIGEGAFSDCPDALVIYGTIGSYAEQYAKNNNITFKVNSKQISGVIVTGLPTMTYNGRAQTPAPVVKIGSTTLKANTDYTVSYKNNTYAGTATVTITGIGNYEGTVTATFTIKKAAQTMTAKAAASSIAVGKTTTVSITGAKGTKSFKSSDISIATVDKSTGKLTAKKVGTVKITATSAATSNFNAASKTVTVKVVPAATASLTAANQATGIKLTWKKVTGATGFLVYRGSSKIATIKSGSTVTCTDSKANTNGTKYTYKIIATASTGNGPAKSVTTYCVARPAISSVTNSASKKMTVKWGKNAKASGYQIHYCTDKTFKSGNKSVSITSASTVSKVIGSLTKNKTYYIRIRTYKTVGSTKYFSSWSPVKSVKISK